MAMNPTKMRAIQNTTDIRCEFCIDQYNISINIFIQIHKFKPNPSSQSTHVDGLTNE